MTWLDVPDPFDERAGAMPVKLVVCGGYGSGKTTFVGAISEIVPITSTNAGARTVRIKRFTVIAARAPHEARRRT